MPEPPPTTPTQADTASTDAPDPPRLDRALAAKVTAGLLALALIGMAVAALTTMVDDEWNHFVDSAVYILTAQSLEAGEGYTYNGEPFSLRPPGLAWVLSHVVEGEFVPEDARSVNLVIQLFAVGAMLFVALAMMRLHGVLLGLLVALLFAVNPTTLQGFNGVFSEFPQMALFFAGAWLLLPAREADGAPGPAVGWWRGGLGALLLGASLLFRSVGLLALPALVLAALLRCWLGARAPAAPAAAIPDATTPGRWAPVLRSCAFAALAFALVVPWMLASRAARDQAPRPVTQWVAFDHVTGLLHVDPRDPDSPLLGLDDLQERLAATTNDVSIGAMGVAGIELTWARRREEASREAADEERIIADDFARGLALALLACLLVTAFTRRSFLDLFALLYVVLILMWFTYVQRMLLPILPLVLSSVVHCLLLLGGWVDRRLPRGQGGDAVWTRVALVGLFALALGYGSFDAKPRKQSEQLKRVARVYSERETARWIAARAAPGDTILAERAPVMALLSGHRSYTWRHLPGDWPDDCPPVDWAVYGPNDKYPELQAALRAAAQEEVVLRHPGRGRETLTVWVYRLGEG